MRIKYHSSHSFIPEVFADADYGGNVTTRKLTSGVITLLCAAPIFWSSKTQSIVAQSTIEAEYYAMGEAIKEALWLIKLYSELPILRLNTTLPLTICDDSQTAIRLADNPQDHGRAKHIDMKWNFIKDTIQQGKLKLEYVSTEHNCAGLLTKALPKPRHEYLI